MIACGTHRGLQVRRKCLRGAARMFRRTAWLIRFFNANHSHLGRPQLGTTRHAKGTLRKSLILETNSLIPFKKRLRLLQQRSRETPTDLDVMLFSTDLAVMLFWSAAVST